MRQTDASKIAAPIGTPSGRAASARPRNWLVQQDWIASGPVEAANRLFRLVSAEVKYAVGIDSFLGTEDRRVLEQIIFPYFLADSRYRDVLFVGCSWCTRGYNRMFEPSKNYWTMDIAPWKRRYGSKHHIVDGIQNVGRYFKPGTLDLIFCNGVYGVGLDERNEIETAFSACIASLRPHGVLVLGWNNTERLNPCPPQTWECLRSLRPFVFPPLQTAEFETATADRHTYSFYRLPGPLEQNPRA